jgi:hypothetical protein
MEEVAHRFAELVGRGLTQHEREAREYATAAA